MLLDWAEALRAAGITRVDGRVVGDDNAFDDAGLGAGLLEVPELQVLAGHEQLEARRLRRVYDSSHPRS